MNTTFRLKVPGFRGVRIVRQKPLVPGASTCGAVPESIAAGINPKYGPRVSGANRGRRTRGRRETLVESELVHPRRPTVGLRARVLPPHVLRVRPRDPRPAVLRRVRLLLSRGDHPARVPDRPSADVRSGFELPLGADEPAAAAVPMVGPAVRVPDLPGLPDPVG